MFSVAKVRVGRLEGPDARDAQRPAARAERRAGPRQVQDAEADPPGQHQAPSRPVRVNVVSKRRHHQTSAACRTLCLLARRAPRTRARSPAARAHARHLSSSTVSQLPPSPPPPCPCACVGSDCTSSLLTLQPCDHVIQCMNL